MSIQRIFSTIVCSFIFIVCSSVPAVAQGSAGGNGPTIFEEVWPDGLRIGTCYLDYSTDTNGDRVCNLVCRRVFGGEVEVTVTPTQCTVGVDVPLGPTGIDLDGEVQCTYEEVSFTFTASDAAGCNPLTGSCTINRGGVTAQCNYQQGSNSASCTLTLNTCGTATVDIQVTLGETWRGRIKICADLSGITSCDFLDRLREIDVEFCEISDQGPGEFPFGGPCLSIPFPGRR